MHKSQLQGKRKESGSFFREKVIRVSWQLAEIRKKEDAANHLPCQKNATTTQSSPSNYP
jgi:hypothetical protein